MRTTQASFPTRVARIKKSNELLEPHHLLGRLGREVNAARLLKPIIMEEDKPTMFRGAFLFATGRHAAIAGNVKR